MIGLNKAYTLVKAGFTIDKILEMEKIDKEEDEKNKKQDPDPAPAPDPDPTPDPDPAPDPDPTPDYQKQIEDLTKQLEEANKTIKEIQDKNIHGNMGPSIEEAKKQEQDSLLTMVRSFM